MTVIGRLLFCSNTQEHCQTFFSLVLFPQSTDGGLTGKMRGDPCNFTIASECSSWCSLASEAEDGGILGKKLYTLPEDVMTSAKTVLTHKQALNGRDTWKH